MKLRHSRYAQGATLGQGAQGIVVRVIDSEAPHRALVAKVWRPGAFDAAALAGEFGLLRRLDIRGLVRAHDLGRDEITGAPFLVEDFVDGVEASELLIGDAPTKAGRLRHMLIELATILGALHRAAFAHGDIKPAHVRITPDGTTFLLDLGSAVSRARSAAAPSAGFTRRFAAPEVRAGGPTTAKSDLYGLGALGWVLATGRAPSKGARLRSLARWVPPSLADVIEWLVAEHPSDRPPDAFAVVTRLVQDKSAPQASSNVPPALVGRTRELESLAEPRVGVRYLVGESGVGKSHLARELFTRALLLGRDARHVTFPTETASAVARLIAFFRGSDEAWPLPAGRTPPMLLVLDDLHMAPAELAAALDGWRCHTEGRASLDVVATAREAPDGANALELGPLPHEALAEIGRRLGVEDVRELEQLARSAQGKPGWLVAARTEVSLTHDMVQARLRELSPAARDRLAVLALSGGDAPESVVASIQKNAPRDASASLAELLAQGLVVRRAGVGSVTYALLAPALAPAIASALGSLDLVERASLAWLDEADAPARSLLAVASAPFAPTRRDELLLGAARAARDAGLRSEEMTALYALAADPKRRTRDVLLRLERLTRDSGGSAGHPQVMAWLAAAADLDVSLKPLSLRRQAEHQARSGDAKAADALVQAAEHASRELGDAVAEGLALSTKGAVALYRADWETADSALTEASARLSSKEVADPEEIARLHHNRGVVALYRDRLDEAIGAFEQSLQAKRRLGDRAGVRSCLLNLGLALSKRGRYEQAEGTLAEAIALARALGQTAGHSWCLAARADLELRRGHPKMAERWIAEAEAIGGVPPVVAADLAILRAEVALHDGDAAGARAALARIDGALRGGDPLLDVRMRICEARALVATLPAKPRAAARMAIEAARFARAAKLAEAEAQALALLRELRRGAVAPMRYDAAVASSKAPKDGEAWTFLAQLAGGLAVDEAALELGRMIAAECGAERVLVAIYAEPLVLRRAWGVDLDGFALSNADERFDRAFAQSALSAQGPVYQRDVESARGRGSRLAIASGASSGERAVVVAEHRFSPGHFDAMSAAAAAQWAVLAQLLARIHPAAEPQRAAARLASVPRADAGVAEPSGDTTVEPLRASRRAFPSIVGESRALQRVLARLDAAIDSDMPVLILGETGTGKELFARALHEHAERKKGAFVAVNCAAIPDSLFESELFGHARGAFTGAERARPGLMASAAGGTLFLDEIGDLPVARQATLLRVLETRSARPIGSDQERPFDARIVAATNQDLESLVERKAFRRDLLYRLNVIELRIPPLRERTEDIALLARRVLAAAGSRAEISPAALHCLETYAWPGNVRELEHQLQRLAALRTRRIEPEHLPREMRRAVPTRRRAAAKREPADPRVEVEHALRVSGGNITHAASVLGLTRHGLKKRMLRLGLRAQGDRSERR